MHARADATSETAPSWPEDVFAILQRFDVRQVPYVPDAGHSQLIERVLGASSMRAVPLTTEEEGVALLAGAWAGGQRGVLLMQSSGVGNCINMLSLTQIFRFPFLTLVTMRGEWGEFNPWQVPMGSSTRGCSNCPESKCCEPRTRRRCARSSRRRRAGLQRLHADRRPVVAAPDRGKGLHQMSKTNLLERRSVVSSLLRQRKDAIVVGGLGASTYDIAAAGDHDRNFYLWGAMGGAVMIGLGVALAQPDLPVVVITGDGEMLMGMGSSRPSACKSLGIHNRRAGQRGLWRNRRAGEPHRGHCRPRRGRPGLRHRGRPRDRDHGRYRGFCAGMQDVKSGPRFASIKIDSANLERVLSSRDGTFIVNRIRGSLGFSPI